MITKRSNLKKAIREATDDEDMEDTEKVLSEVESEITKRVEEDNF